MSQTPSSHRTGERVGVADAHPAADASELTFLVSEMTCDHCKAAVTSGLVKVPGVEAVGVDLETKLVRVRGVDLDDNAVRATIEQAGYTAVPA